jgi:sulfide dehydrogenase cytochrome subunit
MICERRERQARRWSRPLLVGLVLLAPAAIAASPEAPPGAAACSGCHPARAGVGTPVPRLVGRDPSALVAAMLEFRAGKRPATVMDRIAKGFSDDEIGAIAAWYGEQKE